jgi:hypothetical protein
MSQDGVQKNHKLGTSLVRVARRMASAAVGDGADADGGDLQVVLSRMLDLVSVAMNRSQF